MFTLDDLKQTRYFQDVIQEAKVEISRKYILDILRICLTDNVPSKVVEKLNPIKDLSCLKEIHKKSVTAKGFSEFLLIFRTNTE